MVTPEQFSQIINRIHSKNLNQRELVYYLAYNRFELSLFQVNELSSLYEDESSFVKNCVSKGIFKPTNAERSLFGRMGRKLPKVKIPETPLKRKNV